MHSRTSLRRELVAFLVMTFGVTIALALLGKWVSPGISKLIMLAPMLSAFAVQTLVARRPVFRGGELGFRLGRPAYLVLAPLLVAGAVVASLLAAVLVLPGAAVSGAELAERTAKIGLFGTSPVWLQAAAIVGIECLLGPVLNLPIFLGEEVGWRGFLVPRLEQLMPRGRARVIGGAIWGLWHVPMISLFGLNYPDHPWLGLLVWIPICIVLGVALQELYLRSGSIFAVALAHGAMNKVAVVAFTLFLREERLNRLVYGPTGLIGLACFAVLAAIVSSRAAGEVPAAQPTAG